MHQMDMQGTQKLGTQILYKRKGLQRTTANAYIK